MLYTIATIPTTMFIYILDPCMKKSASLMSNKALSTTRSSVHQILQRGASGLWEGYEEKLSEYENILDQEWIYRGYKSNFGLEVLEGNPHFTEPFDNYNLIMSHLAMHSRYYPKDSTSKEFSDVPEVYKQMGIFNIKYTQDAIDDPLIGEKARDLLDGLVPEQMVDSLLFDKLPSYLALTLYCPVVIKTGKNKGEPCGMLLRNHDVCNRHGKLLLKKKSGCRHVTAKGNGCKNGVSGDNIFCSKHNKEYIQDSSDSQCTYVSAKGTACPRKSSDVEGVHYCHIHLPRDKCANENCKAMIPRGDGGRCSKHKRKPIDPKFNIEGYETLSTRQSAKDIIYVSYKKKD